MDIFVNVHTFELKFSMSNHNILLEGSMSQNFDLDLSFSFYVKNRVTFGDFFLWQFLHFIK